MKPTGEPSMRGDQGQLLAEPRGERLHVVGRGAQASCCAGL